MMIKLPMKMMKRILIKMIMEQKILSIIAANSPGNLIGPAFEADFLLAKTEDVSQEWQQQEEDDYVAGFGVG